MRRRKLSVFSWHIGRKGPRNGAEVQPSKSNFHMLTKPWPVERTESRERRVCVASLDDVELIIVLLSSIDNTSR